MFQGEEQECTYLEFLEGGGLEAYLSQLAEFNDSQAEALARLFQDSFNPMWEDALDGKVSHEI